MNPTLFGFYLMLAYPLLILGYDGVLKFALRRPTISSHVWGEGRGRFLVISYLVLWTVGLSAHLGWYWLAGGHPPTPVHP